MAGPWEKYAGVESVAPAAQNAPAPAGPWTKYQSGPAVPSRDAQPAQESGFGAAFESALKSTPETFGKGVEAIGTSAELEPIEHVGRWLMEKTKPAETGYVPLQWKDI